MKTSALTRRHLLAAGISAAGLSLGGALWARHRQAAVSPPTEFEFCVLAPLQVHDPASGLGLLQARPIPVDARCPVCGMFPARTPEWAAQVIFDDGATQFFDSPVSMLIYLMDVGRFARGRRGTEVAARLVRDSRGSRAQPGDWIEAMQAVFVMGSNALGPMRTGNLPAFANQASARDFARQRGGQCVEFTQIPPALIRQLDARSHLGH
ncbi:MAG: hypothetical protein CFE41_09925 [Burkholderiales bacterium PBB2]|nr:MAG: hypothetical protein CFE41_09925 [Burkholderiales bacterium PBB2]